MKKNFNKIILILLFSLGILLISYPVIKNTVTISKIKHAAISYTQRLPENNKNEEVMLPTLAEYLNASTTIENAVGQITIPSVSIDIPIFSGVNTQQLLFGAGLMYPTRQFGLDNVVLIGHHLSVKDLLFSNLINISKKDSIHVVFLGQKFSYQVIDKKIVDETDLRPLENKNGSLLTLITCDKAELTDKRVVVTGRLLTNDELVSENKKTVYKSQTIMRAYTKYSVFPALVVVFLIGLFSRYVWKKL